MKIQIDATVIWDETLVFLCSQLFIFVLMIVSRSTRVLESFSSIFKASMNILLDLSEELLSRVSEGHDILNIHHHVIDSIDVLIDKARVI